MFQWMQKKGIVRLKVSYGFVSQHMVDAQENRAAGGFFDIFIHLECALPSIHSSLTSSSDGTDNHLFGYKSRKGVVRLEIGYPLVSSLLLERKWQIITVL